MTMEEGSSSWARLLLVSEEVGRGAVLSLSEVLLLLDEMHIIVDVVVSMRWSEDEGLYSIVCSTKFCFMFYLYDGSARSQDFNPEIVKRESGGMTSHFHWSLIRMQSSMT
jgi:hypothetical protein